MSVFRGYAWLIVGLGLVLPAVSQGAQPNSNKLKKAIIYPAEGETIDQLKQRGIVRVDNYGSYWIVQATDTQLADLQKSRGERVQKAEHFDKIELSAATIDTTAGEPRVPANLQETATTGRRLRLVQFKGPILPAWLEQIKQAGNVKLIHYVPNNTYLVSVDAQAETNLQQLLDPAGPVQWIGKYQPYYKMRSPLAQTNAPTVEVRLAIADGPEAQQTIQTIERYALKKTGEVRHVLNQVNMQVLVQTSDLPALAQLPDVLWIDPVYRMKRMDGRQGVICATSDNGQSPADYLTFLGSVGFSGNPYAYPTVDIADSGLDNSNPNNPINGNPCFSLTCPWLPIFYVGGGLVDPTAQCGELPNIFQPSRIAYSFSGDTDGHGTVVASLLSGYETEGTEDIHCWVQTFQTNCVTNVTHNVCTTNSFTVGCPPSVCNGPVQPACCTDCSCTNWVIVCGDVTNVTCTTVCIPKEDNPSPQPPDWCLLRGGAGLGISPYGQIGATLGGAEPGFLGPFNHAATAYLNGGRISNNSWGEVFAVGNGGAYDAFSQDYDIVTRDTLPTGSTNPPTPGSSPVNQELFYVFAGGNANAAEGTGGFGDVLVTPPATAKNVIAVGATDLTVPGNITVISSYGPTVDGRFKPEILAPGQDLYGAVSQASYVHQFCGGCSQANPSPPACAEGFFTEPVVMQMYGPAGKYPFGCSYFLRTGTSFAAPAVSGAIQLLWWYFQNRLLMLQPSPAMAKAYVCNAALYLPTPDPLTGIPDQLPSSAQGMGRLDLARMFDGVPRVVRDESTPRAIDSPLLTTNPVPQQTFFSQSGQTYETSGQVFDATKPFRVTLAWTDAPGSPSNFKQLVNDLDLQVVIGGKTYLGNVFDREFSTVDASRGADILNNMESVFLPAGQTGTWSVVVRATNIAGNAIPNVKNATVGQDFALVVYNGTNPSDVANIRTNNSCQTAQTIYHYPYTWTNTLSSAVYHQPNPSPSVGRGGPQEFFKIPRPTPGTTFTATTQGSAFDTILSVWKGSCGTLVEAYSNDNANAGVLWSSVTWTVADTNDYYIIAQPKRSALGTGVLPAKFVLNVQATVPPISFIPSQIDFGTQFLGTSSAIQHAVLHNGSSFNLQVVNVTVEGTNASSFQLLSEDCTAPAFISPGGDCNLYLAFSPTTVGVNTANISVLDDATGSPHILPLTGLGTAPLPLICGLAGNYSFGSYAVGFTSTPVSLTISNCGAADLVVGTPVLSGAGSNDFVIVSDTCATVPAGSACTIGVSFAPTAMGSRLADLTINNNTTNAPAVVHFGGVGSVPAPKVCLNPSSLNFGTVNISTVSAPQTVTITNCGTRALTIYGISLVGTNLGEFLLSTSCPISSPIPIGGSCSITVRFAPLSNGPKTASVSIADDADDTPQVVTLTGTAAIPTPQVCLSSSGLAFGSQSIGTTGTPQGVSINNCGTGPLSVGTVTLSGPGAANFILDAGACSNSIIAVGGACTLGVTYAPVDLGPVSATVTITDNAAGSPHTVLLTGSGVGSLPDASISRTRRAKKYTGERIITPPTSLTAQTLINKVGRGAKPIFFIKFLNSGNTPDSFRVTGPGSNSEFSVKYILGGAPNGVDVTANVVAGNFQTETLAPGAVTGDATLLRAEIKIPKTAVGGTNNVVVTATSTSALAKTDSVRAQLIVPVKRK